MSVEVRQHGDTVTITLTGTHDIIRFADRMIEWQCEFGTAGRHILQRLRRRLGAKGFDAYATYLGLSKHTIAASKRPWSKR